MASNIEQIYTRLTTDAILVGTLDGDGYSGLLQGGVWNRPLKREPPGDTPQAFYPSERGRMLRASAVVIDRGDQPHPQEDAIPSAYVQRIWVYLYAPATRTGKDQVVQARYRVWDLLNDWNFVTERGPVAFVKYSDRVGMFDSEEFPEAVYDLTRYNVTSRNANAV